MRLLLLLSVSVVSLLVVADAEAQWRPERPYRGLFAGGVGETSQLLTATGSLGTGWSDNLVVDPAGEESLLPSVGGRQFSGGVHSASGVLSYSLNLEPITFGATAGTTGDYYASGANRFVRRDYAHVGTSVVMGGGVSVHGSLTYQPYSLLSGYPALYEPGLGAPLIIDEDFPASDEQYLSYTAGVVYSRRISRRNTISAGYDYQGRLAGQDDQARPEIEGDANRYARQSVYGRLTRELGRGLAAHAGYAYSGELYYGAEDTFRYHNIDVGVDFNRALSLSLSRRTMLSFSTGTAIYQATSLDVDRTAQADFHFQLIGSARLSHEMGRTWNATLSYDRGLSLADTWGEPVFSDSVTAGVGGLIAPRTQLQFSGRALYGGGVSGSYGDVQTLHGYGVLSFAMTRHVNTALTYTYYSQDLAEDLSLVEGFPHDSDGQSIRLSVSVWVPVFQRARRP